MSPAPGPTLAVPVRRLRATLRAVVRAVEEDQARVVVTRHGRPVAAVVPVEALEALDLLERLLPPPGAVAAGLRDPDGGGAGDETSGGPAGNRTPEVSVPSPPETPDLHTPGARP
jgi:prevent-host-death family protein